MLTIYVIFIHLKSTLFSLAATLGRLQMMMNLLCLNFTLSTPSCTTLPSSSNKVPPPPHGQSCGSGFFIHIFKWHKISCTFPYKLHHIFYSKGSPSGLLVIPNNDLWIPTYWRTLSSGGGCNPRVQDPGILLKIGRKKNGQERSYHGDEEGRFCL